VERTERTPVMTLEEHVELGKKLADVDKLIRQIRLDRGFSRYSKTSRQSNALNQALKAVSSLRSALEDEVADLLISLNRDEHTAVRIYWPVEQSA
jgi:DNA repair exonuclease SbcCD ATPase subunit